MKTFCVGLRLGLSLMAALTPFAWLQAQDAGTNELGLDFDTLRAPTVLSSVAALGLEYGDSDAGAYRSELSASGSVAFGAADAKDWVVGVALPYVRVKSAGGSSVSGLGDFKVAAGHLVDGAGRFRWGLGVATYFDTAEHAALGDGVLKLSPKWGAGYRFEHDFELVGTVQYNVSLHEAAGRSQVSSLEVNPALIKGWPGHWFNVLGYDQSWDFQDDGRYYSKLKFELGRAFGTDERWVASVGVDVPLAGRGADNYTAKASLSRIFP